MKKCRFSKSILYVAIMLVTHVSLFAQGSVGGVPLVAVL